jgi:hypothetical protein
MLIEALIACELVVIPCGKSTGYLAHLRVAATVLPEKSILRENEAVE